MARPGTYIDIGYASAQEFWDEIVVASAARLKTDPTRAHAMAAAIYLSHFLDWVFHEKHPREDTIGNPVYIAFRQRHHRACPELGWLADLADVAKHRGLGRRQVMLKKLEDSAQQKESSAEEEEASSRSPAAEHPLVLELANGTHHRFDRVVANAIAYWRTNR